MSDTKLTSVQIRVLHCQARNIAAHVLGRARNGEHMQVSDPCVVRELLALAQGQGVKVQFVAEGEGGRWVPVGLDGVKRALEGESEK